MKDQIKNETPEYRDEKIFTIVKLRTIIEKKPNLIRRLWT